MANDRGYGGGGFALAAVAVSAILFAVISWSSARNIDILWDEAVDLQIAAALAEHPIAGEARAIDPSQFRLPMYVTALASKLGGEATLGAARRVSIGAGVVGILAAAGLAWTLFGRATAAITAALLALSPYYLAFGRIAMTEGDIFLAATVALACWSFAVFLAKRTTARWIALGVMLGAALGAKAYALVLVPVFAICLAATPMAGSIARDRSQRLWGMLVISAIGLVFAIIGVQAKPEWAVWAWTATAGLLVATLAVAAVDRSEGLSRVRAFSGVLILAGLVWAVAMPEHLTQPKILRGLVGRAASWDHKPPLAMALDHLRLYSGIVLFKATLPVGVLTVGGLVAGLVRARSDARWRLPTLVALGWVAAICLLPLRQTFYLMGIYPLLMILAAASGVGLTRWLGGGKAVRRAGVAGVALLGPLVWLGLQSWLAYPDYQLYPDRLFTPRYRWLGAEVRGYRNLIQTNSDGVETLLRWCMARVPAGSRVVSYLWEDHILDRDVPSGLPFTLIRRGISQESAVVPAGPSITDADFVLLHLNNFLGYGDRPADLPPLEELRRDFEPVVRIRRGMSPMEVGWVFERRAISGGNPQKY